MKKNFQELLKTIISSSGLNLNKIWGYHFLNFEKLPDSYRQWLLIYHLLFFLANQNLSRENREFWLAYFPGAIEHFCHVTKTLKSRENSPRSEGNFHLWVLNGRDCLRMSRGPRIQYGASGVSSKKVMLKSPDKQQGNPRSPGHRQGRKKTSCLQLILWCSCLQKIGQQKSCE